jgi:hypothetical protein
MLVTAVGTRPQTFQMLSLIANNQTVMHTSNVPNGRHDCCVMKQPSSQAFWNSWEIFLDETFTVYVW